VQRIHVLFALSPRVKISTGAGLWRCTVSSARNSGQLEFPLQRIRNQNTNCVLIAGIDSNRSETNRL
jgi:hypothetical protein